MRRLASACLLLLSIACTPSEPNLAATHGADKQALYGDPALVPTREGERVRRELMLAGELERLLAHADVAASVAVSLLGPGHALIVAHADDQGRVMAIARASLPDEEVAEVELVLVPTRPEPAPERSPLPYVVVALALGLSLGVAGERARIRGAAWR